MPSERACGSSSTQFPPWSGAFGLTALSISSISAGWTIRGLLWRRKSKTQRAHFIPKTFHVSWKSGSWIWPPGNLPRMKCGCSGLTVNIAGSWFARRLCATSGETLLNGTAYRSILRTASGRKASRGLCSMPSLSKSGVARLTAHLTIAMSVGARTWD